MTDLPIEIRLQAYQQAVALSAKKVKTADIVAMLRKRGISANYDTVWSWIRGIRDPFRKLNLVKNYDGDLVELIGMTVGDGSWGKILDGGSYLGGRVSYGSVDLELATRAGKLMAKVLGKDSPYRPFWSDYSHVFVVSSGSKHLAELMQGAIERLRRLIWLHRIRFLKGMYNAEGSVTVRSRRGRVYPRIYFTNSNPIILRLVGRMLKSFGIRFTIELNTKAGKTKSIRGVKTATRKDVYNICIGTRSGVLMFAKLIGFGIIRKSEMLGNVVQQLAHHG